jgi:hypothetical protein
MRIAWFRDSTRDDADPADETAPLIDELRATFDIDVIVERTAHDFVWQHLLRPWDLCVFEVDQTPAHAFISAYLLNYPGVLFLRSTDIPLLRFPMLASRCVVVSHDALAEVLRARYPDVHIRHAPACSRAVAPVDGGRGGSRRTRFAIFDRRTRDAAVIGRAVQRAREAGAEFDVLESDTTDAMLARCDVVVSAGWPPFHSRPAGVLAAMAAGKAVVTMEMEATAGWPAIDPQTWRPRGLGETGAPVAVTIDPRDEEHSLMLAIRRLSSDASLREALGRAARGWWETHATPAHAAAAWMPILQEAVTLSPPARPDDWPARIGADGTELARGILAEFGLASDL